MKNIVHEGRSILMVVSILVIINLIVTIIMYSSFASFRDSVKRGKNLRPDSNLSKELETIKKEIAILQNSKDSSSKYQYPLKRYSIIYNRAMSFLFIIVLLNIGITFLFYWRILRKIEPKQKILSEMRDNILTIKEMISVMPEMDEKGREAILKDVTKLVEKVESSINL